MMMRLNTQQWKNLKNHRKISQTYYYAHVITFNQKILDSSAVTIIKLLYGTLYNSLIRSFYCCLIFACTNLKKKYLKDFYYGLIRHMCVYKLLD